MGHQTNILCVLVPGFDAILDEELVPHRVVRYVATNSKVVTRVCSECTIERVVKGITVNQRIRLIRTTICFLSRLANCVDVRSVSTQLERLSGVCCLEVLPRHLAR